MPGPVSVECPKCGAKLKLKDRSKLGKKAACPRCKKPFVLTAPPEDDELDEFDDFGDLGEHGEEDEEEFAAAPAPRRRSASASRRSSGKKKKGAASTSSGGGKIALFVGGGVIAVLLLVGVSLWAFGVFSGDENRGDQPVADGNANGDGDAADAGNKIDLAWLPADAELIVSLKVSDAWQAPLIRPFVNNQNMVESVAQMQSMIGLAPSDVVSITAGLSGVSDQVEQARNGDPAELALASRENLIAAVRTNKPVDANSLKLLENGCEKVELDGKSYFRFQPPNENPEGPPPEPAAIFLAGPKLVVIGTEERVKSAMASGGKETRRKDLDFIDPQSQLLIALVPRDRSKLTRAFSNTAGGPQDPAGEFAALAEKNLKAVCIGVNVGSGIDLQVQADCTNDKAAGEIKGLLDNYIADARAGFENSKAELPPVLASAIEQVLGSLKTTSRSGTVTASANVSGSTIVALQESAEELMPLLMAGMMGGGNVVPPGGTTDPGGTTTPAVNLPTAAPEGLQVSAIARWSEFQATDFDGNKLPHELELWVYLIGRQAQQAVAWGQVKVGEIAADGGQTLKLKTDKFSSNDPTRTFLPVERNEFSREHPQHGVKAVLTLTPSAQPVSTITRASGTVALQVAGGQKSVVLSNVQSLVGKPIDDPVLKEAGLGLQMTRENNSLNLKVTEGSPFAVAGVEPVDASGKRLEMVNTFRQTSNGQTSYGIFLDNNVPNDLGLKLTVIVGIQQVEVPFNVANVRVPLPPDAPGKPPSRTTGIPAGLTIAAKTDWSSIVESDGTGKELPPALDVLVTALGEPAEKAVAWGFVKVNEVKGQNGVPLKLKVREFSFTGEPTKEFLRVERRGFNAKHPENGVRAVITLEHPAQTMQQLAVVDGSFKLRVAKEQKDVTIPKIASLVAKPIAHRDLTAAGVRFKLERENRSLKLSLVRGSPEAIGEVEIVDAAGKPLENASVTRAQFGEEIYYSISSFQGNLPADAALKLTVNLSLSNLEVPFRFDAVPIPDLPIR